MAMREIDGNSSIPILNSMVKYRDYRGYSGVEAVFVAMGDGTRRKMAARLARGGAMSVSKMAEPFGISLPAALKHLAILERAGIVRSHKRGRVRLCVFDRQAFSAFAAALAKRGFL